MNIEEIIEQLGKMAQHHEICVQAFYSDFLREKYQKWGQTIREAIALLRTHQDAQPNEPLTFEELKKMDGKPVWLNTLCEWFCVDASREPILLWGVRATCYSTVGLLGELYLRPPK